MKFADDRCFLSIRDVSRSVCSDGVFGGDLGMNAVGGLVSLEEGWYGER
jgi:hypothetical protein